MVETLPSKGFKVRLPLFQIVPVIAEAAALKVAVPPWSIARSASVL